MSPLTDSSLAGLLADERRLRALSAVALGAGSAAEVAVVAGLDSRQAAAAVHRLVSAGLLVQDGGLRVALDVLRTLAATAHEPEQEQAAPHLRAFLRGRRLLRLPAQPGRRWDVLAHVAQETFSPGVDYDEAQVNALLAPWCDGADVDHAALRRHLVESGLMSRGSGVYRLGPDAPQPSAGERLLRGSGLS